MARRWGRTAVDVLFSDCQYRKGTALYSQCGVWNTGEKSLNLFTTTSPALDRRDGLAVKRPPLGREIRGSNPASRGGVVPVTQELVL